MNKSRTLAFMSMSRKNRAQVAKETLAILERGEYTLSTGATVSIAKQMAAAKRSTVLYRPSDLEAMLIQVEAKPASPSTTINVSNRTTLEAGRELAQKTTALTCLNFASAKNPGGGFREGSQAQEESLARASGLYGTMQTQLGFYEYHRRGTTCLYSDHAIYSPGVPVFRNDDGDLLATPWQCAFITAAAVNAGAVRRNEPEREKDIIPCLEQRARMVLSIALLQECEVLILGAWGCGVFRNDPVAVAGVFARVLAEPRFHDKFRHVEFAVYDSEVEATTFNAFKAQFLIPAI